MKVLKDNEVVGHIARDLSKYCKSALLRGETMECVVIGKTENKLGNKLEGPRKHIIEEPKYNIANIECMKKNILGEQNFRVYAIF